MARREPPRRPGRTVRAAPRARRARSGHYQAALRFATGLALIVAAAGAAVGVVGYMRASTSQKRVAELQAQLSTLQTRVGADERGAASVQLHLRSVAARATGAQRSLKRVSWQLQSLPNEAQVAAVRGELASYATCVPQLESELQGLAINWRVVPLKPSNDYFKLVTTAPMSASCASILGGR